MAYERPTNSSLVSDASPRRQLMLWTIIVIVVIVLAIIGFLAVVRGRRA